ncbi:MAG: ArsR/SmtB family transcription factor [Candidatus Nanohaloarchaea archaeon]
MRLDFDTVRALSSPTRIKILDEVMRNESTPTSLSSELDRSKSTVSSHLSKLADAGLVEKDSKEGRKRVVYRPTEKAEAIVSGREKKVKFSITSSALMLLGAIGVFGYQSMGLASQGASRDGVSTLTMQSVETVGEAASTSSQMLDPALIKFTGVGLLLLSAGFFAYGLVMSRFSN